jgi:hypothetical protein
MIVAVPLSESGSGIGQVLAISMLLLIRLSHRLCYSTRAAELFASGALRLTYRDMSFLRSINSYYNAYPHSGILQQILRRSFFSS